MEKKVFKIFFAWQDDKEEIWLRSMANQGWALKDYHRLRYTFVPSEPQDIHYQLDYQVVEDDNLEEYKTIYKDAGWEYVTQFFNWHYFRTTEKNAYIPDIYSDRVSKQQKYKGLLSVMLIGLFSIALASISVFVIPNDYLIVSILRWAYVFVFVISLIAIGKVLFKIKSLE